MSFSVSDEAERLRVLARAAPSGLFAQRSNLARPRFHADGRRLRALQPRGARAARRRRRRPLAAATGSTTSGFSRSFVERLIVPQASAVWSADPRADVDVPGALPRRVLRQPRDARRSRGRPHWRDDRAAARARYVEALTAPVRATASASRTPVAAVDAATPTHVDVVPRRRGRRALRRGRARHPRRPGAGAARRPERRASTRSSARSPTSPTRRSCTPTARCCRAAARAWASWNYHLLARAARPLRR